MLSDHSASISLSTRLTRLMNFNGFTGLLPSNLMPKKLSEVLKCSNNVGDLLNWFKFKVAEGHKVLGFDLRRGGRVDGRGRLLDGWYGV